MANIKCEIKNVLKNNKSEDFNSENDDMFDEIVNLVEEENDKKMSEYIDENDIEKFQAYVYNYDLNYKKTELVHIAKYYELQIGRKNKIDLINQIVEYELNPENIEFVNQRKLYWNYIEELQADPYLSAFIHFE